MQGEDDGVCEDERIGGDDGWGDDEGGKKSVRKTGEGKTGKEGSGWIRKRRTQHREQW